MMGSEKRNINLDVNRLMACIAVVGLHTFKCDISAVNSVIYYLCAFAIPFFFMSSGYILLNRSKLTFQYFSKKSVQILGVVIAWNVLLFICKLLYRLLITHQSDIGIAELFYMIAGSLIQKNTLSHFWYMGALMIVYFFACVLFKCNLREKYRRLLWLCLAVVSVGIQAVSLLLGYSLQEGVIQTFRLWTYFQYFMLGGLMPAFVAWFSRKINLYCHIALAVSFGIVIPIYGLLNARLNPHAEYLYDDILLIAGVVLFFSLIMRVRISEKAARLVQHLMPCTMGVYIIHLLIIKGLVHFIPLNSLLSACVVFVITLIVSFAASFCISRVPVACRLIKL